MSAWNCCVRSCERISAVIILVRAFLKTALMRDIEGGYRKGPNFMKSEQIIGYHYTVYEYIFQDYAMTYEYDQNHVIPPLGGSVVNSQYIN